MKPSGNGWLHQAQLERSTEGPERTEAKTLVPSKVQGHDITTSQSW